MKKLILIFCCFHLLINSFAQQPCNDDLIMNKKGSWKKSNDANVFPDQSFPKNQFPQVHNRLDKIQNLLQTAYPQPKGIEAEWYRSISGEAAVKAGPVPYALNALFHAYFCNTYENKIEAGDETGTWLYVWANQLNSWFAKYIKYYVIQKQPVYLLNKRIGELKGYPLFEGNYNQTSNTGTRYSRAIILTRNGQSPYLPVTKKQFLKAFLSYNEKRFQKDLEFQRNRPVKTAEEEELDKKANLKILERVTPPAKLAGAQDNFLKNYISSAQRKEKMIEDVQKWHDTKMKPARELLADSLKPELQQPAILDFNNLLEFKEFITEEKGGQQLVRLNPGYFDLNLPKYVPQLFIVHWSWDKAKPQENFKNQLEADFNFSELKQMIDK